MFSNRELTEYGDGNWRIDCPGLRLIRRGQTKPRSLSGAGEIALSKDRTLGVKLYSSRAITEKDWFTGFVLPEHQLPAGTLVPESSYFDLEAVDFRGRDWVAERIRPSFSRAANGHVIADVQLPRLKSIESIPTDGERFSVKLHVFEDIQIPTNRIIREEASIAAGTHTEKRLSRDAWQLRVAKTDFLLARRRHDHLEIGANRKLPAPRFLRERIIETLQLLLGRPIPWTISLELRGTDLTTELRSRKWLPPNARHRPPLEPQSLVDPDDSRKRTTTRHHRRLFERFLLHILDHAEERHPLWGHLNALYESSATRFIDAHALTVTVVIEALLAREFPDFGRPGEDILEAVDVAKKLIDDANFNSEKVTNRIKGAIGQVKGTTASARLNDLVQRGEITDRQRKAWQELRNASTHSYQIQRLSSHRLRELLRINEVLFTHLVFCLIGYRGPFRDYSKPGWPLRHYPEEAN